MLLAEEPSSNASQRVSGVKEVIKWWKSRPQGARDKRKRVRSEAMEPRVLFSADLPWTALDPDATDVSGHAFELTVDAQDTEALTDQININELRPTLVVVDESYLVAEQTSAEQLTSDLNLEPGDLRFLDSSLNGITQVSALLEGSSALSSLELLTTAESGGLNLGAQTLGTNDLLNSAQELLGWSDQLDGGAEFNIQAQGLSQFTDSEEFGTVLDQLVPSDVTLSDQVDLSAFVSADAQSQELLFIDSGVENYQALVDDIQNTSDPSRSITVVILDPTRDGVQQISETLAGYSDLDSIHIVSHGSEGSVELGDSTLSSSTLAGYEDELAQWRTALSEDADLLFYGCDIAGNAGGESLVHAIAQLTGADVAASNDLTGAEALGGDWDLEFIAGDVDSQVAFSAAAVANWQQVLTSESGGLRINQDGGNDNFLQADDGDGLLTLATSLTYETRFSSTDTGNQALLSYALPGNDDQLGIIIQSDGDLRLEVAGAGLEINAIDYRTLSDGEPHTLSVTWDNSAGDWAVYVDGELVESGSGLATGQSIGSATSGGVSRSMQRCSNLGCLTTFEPQPKSQPIIKRQS